MSTPLSLTRSSVQEVIFYTKLFLDLISWLRRHPKAVTAIRLVMAGILSLGYLTWFGMVTVAWGLTTASAVQTPSFFGPSSFLGYTIATMIFFVVLVGLPAFPMDWVLRHLVPDIYPRKRAGKKPFRMIDWRKTRRKLPAAASTELPSAYSS